ncbi:MAG TPA: hypothetical protein DCX12_00985 [Chloroflexi bacterium]|jgi:FkbM family methyltransferase|nr:hypothetical protein [Chloroflexota bacterium]
MIERQWLESHFAGRAGRFLEIGAFDGFTGSLTFGLIQADWRGVLVEPDPRAFCRLKSLWGNGTPNLDLVNAAVAARGGLRWFYQDVGAAGDGQTSTLVPEVAQGFAERRGARYRTHWTHAVSVADLLACFGTDFDLVVIDAEGLDWEILSAMPLAAMYGTEVIVAENPAAVADLLAPWYTEALRTPDNLIAVRRSDT